MILAYKSKMAHNKLLWAIFIGPKGPSKPASCAMARPERELMRVSTLILCSFAKRYRFALGFNLAEGAAPKKLDLTHHLI